jgi:hypothetical protein
VVVLVVVVLVVVVLVVDVLVVDVLVIDVVVLLVDVEVGADVVLVGVAATLVPGVLAAGIEVVVVVDVGVAAASAAPSPPSLQAAPTAATSSTAVRERARRRVTASMMAWRGPRWGSYPPLNVLRQCSQRHRSSWYSTDDPARKDRR